MDPDSVSVLRLTYLRPRLSYSPWPSSLAPHHPCATPSTLTRAPRPYLRAQNSGSPNRQLLLSAILGTVLPILAIAAIVVGVAIAVQRIRAEKMRAMASAGLPTQAPGGQNGRPANGATGTSDPVQHMGGQGRAQDTVTGMPVGYSPQADQGVVIGMPVHVVQGQQASAYGRQVEMVTM